MFGLSVLDIAVIVIYFSVVICIGFWAMRRINTQEDYFLGGRRFGKLIQIFSAFSQSTTPDTAVSTTTTTVTNGAAGIWSSLNLLFATPIYWMICPWYRRLRITTMGDFFEERYGSRRLAAVYSIVGVLGLMVLLSVGYSAMSKTIMALTPKSIEELSPAERAEYEAAIELDRLESADYATLDTEERTRLKELQMARPHKIHSHINDKALVLVVSLCVLIYAAAGGLEAAFVSDMIQGMFILILSVILLPFIWMKINAQFGSHGLLGALRTVHQQLPESFFEVFGSPLTIDFTWYYIVAVTLMVVINIAVQANQITAVGSSKDELTARFGFTTGSFMKRIATLLWGVFALGAALAYRGVLRDPDMVWGYAALDLLGPLNIGLVGLIIACLMAALMSTADCLMITCSGLLTHNIYRIVVPGRTERHYVKAGRMFGAVVILGTAVIAMQFESLFEQIKFLWEFNIIFGASFWLGMLWRRANCRAAWISVMVTLCAFFILPIFTPMVLPGLSTNSYLLKTTDPQPLVRSYIAREADVTARNEEITHWDIQKARGEDVGSRPESIQAGEIFSRTYKLPPRAIFWTDGVRVNEQGIRRGYGRLNFDLVIIDALGSDLSKNPNALNETIRVLLRLVTPFLIILLLGMVTRADDEQAPDRFYAKMKTPVIQNREEDSRELELSYADPHRFDHLKMFPGSNWEMCRWDKVDIIGFTTSVCIAVAIIGAFFLVVSIGG